MQKETGAFLIIENKSCKRSRLASIHIIVMAVIAFLVVAGYGRIFYHAGGYVISRGALAFEAKKHELLLKEAGFLNDFVQSVAGSQDDEPDGFDSYPGITPVSLSMGYDFFESVDVYKKSADNDLTQTKQKYFKAPQDTFSIKYAHSNSQFIPQGIPSKGWISSYFGSRTDPVFEGTAFHRGIDIAQLQGKPVWATADGKVTFAGKKRYFGNVVEVDHPESGYKTIYAHLQTINVRTGYAVTRGQRVGSVGSTGKSTGPHLHYEVHFQNRAVDPLEFMFDPDVMP